MILYVETHWILSCVQAEKGEALNLLPETYKAIKRANGYVNASRMSRGDAIVLATVIEHAAGQGAPRKAFLSGNTADFGARTEAEEELASAGIKSFSSAQNALGWLTRSASPEEPPPA